MSPSLPLSDGRRLPTHPSMPSLAPSSSPLRQPMPLHPFCLFLFIFFTISLFPQFAFGQALSDPSTQYIEGRLANRRIWWCPSGYGYLAYCPQPTDWDNYNWCCTFPYFGSWKPSCCPFAIPTGAVIAVIIAAIILVAVLVGLSCWCCYFCPLYKQLYEYDEEEEPVPAPSGTAGGQRETFFEERQQRG